VFLRYMTRSEPKTSNCFSFLTHSPSIKASLINRSGDFSCTWESRN
jgi:hypothetical protein